jgi:predicted nucleotidyltransferase
MHRRIQAELLRLEQAQSIRILYAAEAGSRAWGFPSPDSDYDVRFIYCHPTAWYLGLDEQPDTLHLPITDELDLSGWELRKTLRLLRTSNAALLELLQSPIVYHESLNLRPRLWPLAAEAAHPTGVWFHYFGLLRGLMKQELLGPEVRLKKLFYGLRSVLAMQWIRLHQAAPPMEFQHLAPLLPPELQAEAQELLRRKATADERTTVPLPPGIGALLAREYAQAEAAPAVSLPPFGRGNPTPALNELLLQVLAEAF